MDFNVYQKGIEERQKKDQQFSELKDLVFKMGNAMEKLQSSVKFYRKEFLAYKDQYGSSTLTEKELEKIREKKTIVGSAS